MSYSIGDKITCTKHTGTLVNENKLIYAARQLEGRTVESIPNEAMLYVVRRMKGGKPVIYLFSSAPMDAQVLLELVPEWSFSALYPMKKIEDAPNGGQNVAWDVSVRPNGILVDKDSQTEISYLYWEAKSNPLLPTPATAFSASPINQSPAKSEVFNPAYPIITPFNSILMGIDQVPLYLDKALLTLGLHTEARTSFVTYWLPDILKHKFIALRFAPQDAYESAAPLKAEPAPSVMVRIFMLWRGVLPCEVEEEEEGWAEAVNRAQEMDVEEWREIVGMPEFICPQVEGDGLRVLEWGGMGVF